MASRFLDTYFDVGSLASSRQDRLLPNSPPKCRLVQEDGTVMILPEAALADSLRLLREPRRARDQFIDPPISDLQGSRSAALPLKTHAIELARHYRHLARLLWAFGTGRRRPRLQASVKSEYEDYARRNTPDWNGLALPQLYLVNRRRVLLPLLAFRLEIAKALADAISTTGARTILEIGCGEGINIGLFAKMYPDQFRRGVWLGLDYSVVRVRRAMALLYDHLRVANAFVWNGDAKATCLKPKAIDLCFTSHVLEQMPYDWQSAMEEMRRISRYVLLAEPFYEAKSWAGKLHSRVSDYFTARISDICALGFRLIERHPSPIQEPYNQTTLVFLESN